MATPNFLFYLFIYLFCHVSCGILVPRPGVQPAPPAVEAWSLNHWTTREVPKWLFLGFFLKYLFIYLLVVLGVSCGRRAP